MTNSSWNEPTCTKMLKYRPEYYHRPSENIWKKIDLCTTKATSQRTQLSKISYKLSTS